MTGVDDRGVELHPRRLDAWERRELPVLSRLPYAMLGFCVLLTVLVSGGGRLANLGLCGLALAWLLAGAAAGFGIGQDDDSDDRPAFTMNGFSWTRRPWAAAVFFAGLIALMAVMVIRDPWYGFFTFTGYLYAAQLPFLSWRMAGVAAVAILTGGSQAGGLPTAMSGPVGAAVFAGCIVVNMAVSSAFMWFAWVGHVQGERRVRLVEELSQANQRLEATLAENAGLHAQLLAQAREAGVLDERQRMAREIHDTLAQGLAGIITQLQAAEQAEAGSGEQRRHLATATRLARDGLTEARRSVEALRPEPLEKARLGEALAGVADKWSALHGVAVQVTTTGEERVLAPETEVVLLRTAQEALANVAKHAAATRVWLTLSYMDREVALDVRDDGRGFLPAALAASDRGGFGLLAMRQRVEGVSGTLQVESEPGEGTTISACVPVEHDGQALPAAAAQEKAEVA